jgi:6-phosphogluconolactonase (cycloisomerase 2 family)
MKTISLVAIAAALFVGSLILPAVSAAATFDDDEGAVFVMTNAADNNEVQSYVRSEDGSLHAAGSFATGGAGSGGTVDPLSSQGSLTLADHHEFLFAVNAGSGTVSSFHVHGANLTLVDTEPSGGSSPVALAYSHGLLYVLNSGDNGNVYGFAVLPDGRLSAIKSSSRPLSANDAGGSSLAFSPDRRFLVATERLTNKIDVYAVRPDGSLSDGVANASSGAVPFAALFAPNGALTVAEASNSISSYEVLPNGTLKVLTASLPTDGMATCWSAIAPDGRFVYTSNAATSTISGFEISRYGSLTPLPGTVVASNPAGSVNLDITIAAHGKYLYTLDTGTGSLSIFLIERDGSLESLGIVDDLPVAAGLNGIAAY